MFQWIQSRIRTAVVRGVHEGLVDAGIIDPDVAVGQEAEAIRAAIADKPDEPRRGRKDKS